MKKNKMMRVAAVMLVCVLLSTSIISGTFAKYVTAADVADTARVAKWGVEVTASGSLFEYRYSNDGTVEKDENGNDISYTVVCSSTSQDVVAPGTKSSDTGLTFTITGQPEVAVNIDFNITGDKDVVLPAGPYLDYTTGNDQADTFTLADPYYPIVYTLKKGATAATASVVHDDTHSKDLEGVHMSDIVAYLNDIEGNYESNTDLGTTFGTYYLTWEWVFGDAANNKADTFLGQMAAKNLTVTGASIEAGVSIAITVAQVD